MLKSKGPSTEPCGTLVRYIADNAGNCTNLSTQSFVQENDFDDDT